MNHLIIAKFKPGYSKRDKEKMYPDIRKIFDNAVKIDGINAVEYHYNCTDRDNRYDIMINVIMNAEALPLWDTCEWHKEWKKTYGDMLLAKCIFDYED